jgi:hypothetical protein
MLILPAGKTNGQKFEFFGSIGYGHCKMQDLKDFQALRLKDIILPAKITEDFPWTIHYGGEFNVQFKKCSAGFSYFFLTSGSRISYSDYSGEINMDVTAIAHGFGPLIICPLYKNDKFWFGPRLQIPLMFSRVTENNYIRLLNESESYNHKTYSWSIGLFPSFEANYSLPRLSFGLNLGYLIDSKGRIVEENDMTIYFGNKYQNTTEWSGFQFDFRIGYTLFSL